MSREEALLHRQSVYGLFRQAFGCELVIVTLGLVEAWWDKTSQQYVEFNAAYRNHDEASRFVFRRLDFAECYRFTRLAIELLNRESPRKVMLTVSPIPMSRTFTQDDVITANQYSKSVLRAVAGEIAQDCPGVDYFPSYESVMLTRQDGVWADDLIHVAKTFTGRIMSRVCETYLKEGEHGHDLGARNAFLRVAGLVRDGRMEEAHAIYSELDNPSPEKAPPVCHLMLARLLLHYGAAARARVFVDSYLRQSTAKGANPVDLHQAWRMLEELEDWPEAARVKTRYEDVLRQYPRLLTGLTKYLEVQAPGDIDGVFNFAEESIRDVGALAFIGQHYLRRGRHADAKRAIAIALKELPDSPELCSLYGRILVMSGDLDKAAEISARLARTAPTDDRSLQLSKLIKNRQAALARTSRIDETTSAKV